MLQADGRTGLDFVGLPDGMYYIVVRHHCHTDVGRAQAVIFIQGENQQYDFTTGMTQAMGTNQLTVLSNNTVTALKTRDLNGDSITTVSDFNVFVQDLQTAPSLPYLPTDCNLDGMLTTEDFKRHKERVNKLPFLLPY